VRVIVCGGRNYYNADTIGKAMANAAPGKHTLVHGAQTGADTVAADIAKARGWTVEPHPPNVERYGSPAAFHIRNADMIEAGADILLAFPGGAGTASMVRRARKAGIHVREVK
jgi:predicted Rossmann-fold nucleotide-binding protein